MGQNSLSTRETWRIGREDPALFDKHDDVSGPINNLKRQKAKCNSERGHQRKSGSVGHDFLETWQTKRYKQSVEDFKINPGDKLFTTSLRTSALALPPSTTRFPSANSRRSYREIRAPSAGSGQLGEEVW